MKFKLYLSYGMTKCGSTLAYRFMRKLLETNGYKQEVLPEEALGQRRTINFIESPTPEQLGRIIKIVEDTRTPLVIKTHTPPTDGMLELLASGEAHAHAVFRDPREMALSMLDHGVKSREIGRTEFTEFFEISDTITDIEKQMQFFSGWVDAPATDLWFYDEFAWDHETALERLKKQTGLGGNVRKMVRDLNPTKKTAFNKGQRERWRDDMTAEDSELIRARFADFYTKFVDPRIAVEGA